MEVYQSMLQAASAFGASCALAEPFDPARSAERCRGIGRIIMNPDPLSLYAKSHLCWLSGGYRFRCRTIETTELTRGLQSPSDRPAAWTNRDRLRGPTRDHGKPFLKAYKLNQAAKAL